MVDHTPAPEVAADLRRFDIVAGGLGLTESDARVVSASVDENGHCTVVVHVAGGDQTMTVDAATPVEAVRRPTYTTRDEALREEVVRPIEAGGVVEDAYAEFDVEAIATEVLGDHAAGYGSRVLDADGFWEVVKKHATR